MTQTLTNSPKKLVHLPYLDSLRGLSALYVVMVHLLMTLPANGNLPSDKVFAAIFKYGHSAVDLFIILSGFCLMLPVIRNEGKLRGSIILFFKKRVRRILPPYYITIGLSLLLIATVIGEKTGSQWDSAIPVTMEGIIAHLILIHDFFSGINFQINGVLWSISVEFRIYLLFPLILFFWRKLGGFTTTLITIVLSYALFIPLNLLHLNTSPWGICPHYFGLFTLGMLAVEVAFSQEDTYTNIRKKLPWGLMTLVFAGVAIIAFRTIFISPFVTPLWSLCDLAAGICFFCLLISVSSNQKNWFYPILAWKPLVFIGTFSYSIYLIHSPLMQLFYQYIVKPLALTSFISTPILSCLMIIFIIPISYLFFLIAEKPFMNNKKLS